MSSLLGVFIKRDDSQDPDRPFNVGGSQDVADAHARMTKVFGSAVHAKYIHQRDKNAVVVVRHMAILEDPFDNGEYPLTAAGALVYWREVAAPFIAQFADKSRYIFCLPPNEPGVSDGELAALTEWWTTLCGLAAAAGVMICVGNWSAEARLWDKAAKVVNIVKACIAGGHWWDQHGYAPDLLDIIYEEFLYPWRKFRAALRALGIDISKLKILAGEWGEDENLFLHVQLPGYRTHMSNETYAAQLIEAAVRLAVDGVVAFIYWMSFANDAQFTQYNIAIGTPGDKQHEPDPSVWERIWSWIVAQASIIEVPPPAPEPPPVTTGPVLAADYNVRWTPDKSSSGNIIVTNRTARPVEVVGQDGDWKKIVVYVHEDGIK